MKPATAIRVLHVLEATTGGTRRHLRDVALGLDHARCAVSVLCATARDPHFLADLDLLAERGVRVIEVPMVRAIAPWRDLPALWQIRGHLLRGHYDVVHTHSAKGGFLGRLAARQAGIRCVIHTPHVFPFEMQVDHLRRALYRGLERLASHWTDTLVCLYTAQVDAALAAGLRPRRGCVVIPNGIVLPTPTDTSDQVRRLRDELHLTPEQLVIGTVGRFTRQKGHGCLLDAAVRVCRDVPGAVFVLIGDGAARGALEAQARRRGLADRIRFLEARDELAPCYAMFDLFALPSLWEGLPYTLLEAMAAGCPVVATSVGGIPSVVREGVNGVLVPPAKPEPLAAALTALLRDQPRRAALGAAGRQTAQGYRVEEMVRKLEQLYLNTARFLPPD